MASGTTKSDSKEAPRFSVSNMDRSVDPRKDFYEFSTGNWIKSHPVPPDKAVFASYHELYDWNLDQLHEIAEECAGSPGNSTTYTRMVGSFYRSAMDEQRTERLAFSPIDPLWDRVEQARTIGEIAELVPELHMSGVTAFFDAFTDPDAKDSSIYAIYLFQGGISLPDRDYYLEDKFAETRRQFLEHVARMFSLKGTDEDTARQMAEAVLRFETGLARVSRSKADLRDLEKNYNKEPVQKLDGDYGRLALTSYLKGTGVPSPEYAIVGQPEFLSYVNQQLSLEGMALIRPYLQWQVLHAYAPYLHSAVVSEDFDFFKRKLLGQEEDEQLWKRSVKTIDSMIGEALGSLYVERHFSGETRQRAMELVSDIIESFRERLSQLPWMSEATRRRALLKLSRLGTKIGHPDRFRDYTGLEIRDDDYVGNIQRSIAFEVRRQAVRVGKPVDRKEWHMTPPTVNAYFSPMVNEIVFPAGIFQPPYFDVTMDDAVNYGGIGTVIGHEITHGYDDQGRKFDENGNMNDWWPEADKGAFQERADKVVKAYSAVEALPGMFINGMLTLGENIADLGGVKIAYDALQARLKKDPSRRKTLDGFTAEQRFFISASQNWKQTIRDGELRKRLLIDPHSPARYRGTIPIVNHPGFDDAFKPEGSEEEKHRIGVW